ncbi:hypothetical protein BIFADO_01646 [Bifidobacterium adolescentis L2-32]|uniref:Uncharacterized protein n=1 Tax=Bifidobacterium adolescentis L2-32 TaxID=411481 RepID=A7A710_BIFAD|nr:hypothetical protein BIFADO_01646 [Bifidobacterium adolescentis L2-32]
MRFETKTCYAVACNRSIEKALPMPAGLFSYPGWLAERPKAPAC